MKSLSNLIHRVSWPILIVGGLLVVIALAAFVTPFHVIDLRNDGASAEEKRAIKREIDNTFAEGALDVSRQAILAVPTATRGGRGSGVCAAKSEVARRRVATRKRSEESMGCGERGTGRGLATV